ncbi:hypothetical protein SCALM49S_05387 [Streptomyces californicus]
MGAATTLLFTLPEELLGGYLGFFGGALLYLAAAEILPELVQRIGELVQHVQLVRLGRQVALDLLPALAGLLLVVELAVALDPGPALRPSCASRPCRPRRFAPSTLSAFSSPTFHFADFTNWNTPIGHPWFHARSARPKAAVRPPLPTPVWTNRRGRLRR